MFGGKLWTTFGASVGIFTGIGFADGCKMYKIKTTINK